MLTRELRRCCLAPSYDPAFISRHYHGHFVADFDDWREDVTLVVIIEHEEPIHSDSIA